MIESSMPLDQCQIGQCVRTLYAWTRQICGTLGA
jgi:hypothetical protein